MHVWSSLCCANVSLHDAAVSWCYVITCCAVTVLQYYTDEEHGGSQSLDSEGAPPVMSQGSYNNLYNANSQEDLQLGDSAHKLCSHQTATGSNHVSIDPRGPGGAAALSGSGSVIVGGHITGSVPVSVAAAQLQQRNQYVAAYGTRQSPGLAKRATIDTSTKQYPLSGAAPLGAGSGIAGQGALPQSPSGGALSLASDAKYPTTHALITDTLGPSPLRPTLSAHKSNSTGSLGTASRAPQSRPNVARISPTLPAQSVTVSYYPGGSMSSAHKPVGLPPSQHSVASSHRPHKSSKGGAGSSAAARRYKESGYSSSASRAPSAADGRYQHHQHHHQAPPHVQPHSIAARTLPAGVLSSGEISNVPGAVKRPMSFVKALEMADQLQMVERQKEAQSMRSLNRPYDVGDAAAAAAADSNDDSQQHYGSSYEISV